MPELQIEEWTETNPRSPEVVGLLECAGQASYAVGHEENHRLKLRLGFGAHPHVRALEGGEGRPGFFFVKVVV